MTIDEAIEVLQELVAAYGKCSGKGKVACQLGIEALEKVKYLRGLMGMPLPLLSEKEDAVQR